MSHDLKPFHLFTLLLLIAFASVTGLLFIPALPELDDYFHISNTKAQWTLSIFLVGYCIGQLPYGPLANRYGRKKTIYIGILLTILGSLFSYLAESFWILCIARFIQALGAAVGLKMSFTIIGDKYSGKEAAKVISLLSLAFGIMPGLAVATGGFVVTFAGWKGCFLFLTLYSIVVGLLSISLPETVKTLDVKALHWLQILKAYAHQFRNKNLVLNAMIVALSTSLIYIFATVAPYIGIERLKMSFSEFGLWNIVPATGLVCGALLSRQLSMKYSMEKNMLYGICIVFFGVSAMIVSFAFGFINKWTLFIPQFIIQAGYIRSGLMLALGLCLIAKINLMQ